MRWSYLRSVSASSSLDGGLVESVGISRAGLSDHTKWLLRLSLCLLVEGRGVEVERGSRSSLWKTGEWKAEGHQWSAIERIRRLSEGVRQWKSARFVVLVVDFLLLLQIGPKTAGDQVLEEVSRQLAGDLRHVGKRGLDHIG